MRFNSSLLMFFCSIFFVEYYNLISHSSEIEKLIRSPPHSISDTGNGISEEQQKRIFNPFECLAEHRAMDGAGIGLTISKYIVEYMKGEIGVESIVGKGATFWLDIPLVKA